MSKLLKTFGNGKAFIGFITAGDPNLDITEQLVYAMEDAGADLIELGIPFSDPVAEGVVIQRASERALSRGTTTDKIFDMVRRVRRKSNVPLAFMTYVNLVFAYGTERFLKNCRECGIDALILPDVPFEEKEEVAPACEKYGIDFISLIAPTSRERIHMIARQVKGFVYCVSSLGVTGMRSTFSADLGEMVRQVKSVQNIPCAIGFGISTPEQAHEMAQHCDGVITGSAIVKIVEQYGENCVEPVSDYVRKMKQAVMAAK